MKHGRENGRLLHISTESWSLLPLSTLHLDIFVACVSRLLSQVGRCDSGAMATPSSKSVKSEIPNTIRVDWNDAELNAHTLFCDDQKLIAAVSLVPYFGFRSPRIGRLEKVA